MSDCRHKRSNHGLEAGSVQNQRQQVIDGKTREQLVDELTDRVDGLYGDIDLDRIESLIAQIEEFGPILQKEHNVELELHEFMSKVDINSLDSEDKKTQKEPRKRFGHIARIAIVAAALTGFVFTSQGTGFSVLDAIVEWTSETLHYVTGHETNPSKVPESEFSSLQEALEESNVIENLSPKWFRNDSELVEIKVKSLKGFPMFTAKYDVSGEELYITIRKVDIGIQPEVEKNDDEAVQVYIVNEIEHQITSDIKQNKVVWRNNDWECYIAGNISKEALAAMIDSIYD